MFRGTCSRVTCKQLIHMFSRLLIKAVGISHPILKILLALICKAIIKLFPYRTLEFSTGVVGES